MIKYSDRYKVVEWKKSLQIKITAHSHLGMMTFPPDVKNPYIDLFICLDCIQ